MNNISNVSFQGKTDLFFNPKAYDKARIVTQQRSWHLEPNNRCTLTNGKFLTANADAENLVVIVRNENKGYVTFLPIKQSIEEGLLKIQTEVDALLKNAKSNLTAWIIGGSSFDSKLGQETIDAVNDVAQILCEKPKIDASIIAGSKSGDDKMVIHTLKDKLELTLDKEIDHNNSVQEELKNLFDIVELNNINLPN